MPKIEDFGQSPLTYGQDHNGPDYDPTRQAAQKIMSEANCKKKCIEALLPMDIPSE